jgi:hypothetical protein
MTSEKKVSPFFVPIPSPGGPDHALENSAGLDVRSGIHDFWTWLKVGRKDRIEAMFESDTRERNTDTTTITEDVTMIEVGTRESNVYSGGVTQTEGIQGAGACEKEGNFF